MEAHPSVLEFFHDAVTEAMKSQQVEATEPTEFYVVNLLAEFVNASHVDESPLALKMAQVQAASPQERMRALKDIGDTSLYVSGFFADSLTRRLVDVDYYIAIGGSAYRQLARLPGGSRQGTSFFRDVYGELSEKFARFVAVLTEIRRRTNFASGSPANLIRLYEEWVRTGSEWLERRLRESGLLPAEAFAHTKKLVH